MIHPVAADLFLEKFCLRSRKVAMSANAFYTFSMFLACSPTFVISGILVHFLIRRAAWRRNKRLGRKNRRFCPSTAALGVMFLFMQIFSRPSMAHVLEAKLDEEAEDDAEGDPETLTKQLNRQLRCIRRGEQVDQLVLRL